MEVIRSGANLIMEFAKYRLLLPVKPANSEIPPVTLRNIMRIIESRSDEVIKNGQLILVQSGFISDIMVQNKSG